MDKHDVIWSNCPACAYKHLTTAYAALTTVPQCHVRLQVPLAEVLLARARIAGAEAAAGYRGNVALAVGCANLVEESNQGPVRAGLRQFRLALTGTPDKEPYDFQAGVWADDLSKISPWSPESSVIANLLEAARECPAVAEAVNRMIFFTEAPESGSAEFISCEISDLANGLIETIALLERDYNLTIRSTPQESPQEPPCHTPD